MSELSPEKSNAKGDLALIDLSGVCLDDVARLDDSALFHSLKRVLGDVKNPDAVVLASFSAVV